MERAYLDAIAKLRPEGSPTRDLRIVYTPMHGVGNRLTRQAKAEAGSTNVTSVPRQPPPRGRAPTRALPRPPQKARLDRTFRPGRRPGSGR